MSLLLMMTSDPGAPDPLAQRLGGLWAFVVVLSLVYAGYKWMNHRRAIAELRAVAAQRGWDWQHAGWFRSVPLPADFPLRELSTERYRQINVKNTMSGTQNGRRFLLCDCMLRSGRVRKRMSLLSVQTATDPFAGVGAQGRPECTYTQAGGWFAAQPRRGFNLGGKTWTAIETMALLDNL